ncbi:MAG: NAD-dependent epimerase/dehydratase family protein, partial [Trueperaceae bacterium]
MTRPVLVTGATGFVGGRIVQRLVDDGVPVAATARRDSHDRHLPRLGVEIRQADLRDENALRRACGGVRAVVHAAGLTRARNDAELFDANAAGTERVARAALSGGADRFVHVSSLAARGPDRNADDESGPDASGVDAPAHAYGASKLESERRLRALAPDGWAVALRPSAVYGPGDADLLPLFVLARRGLLPTPPARMTLQPVYADDLADLVARIVARTSLPGFG